MYTKKENTMFISSKNMAKISIEKGHSQGHKVTDLNKILFTERAPLVKYAYQIGL